MSNYDISKPYIQYCEDILNGRIASCEAIFLQCKNFKERFNRDDIWFDYEDVDRRVRFVSKMKHWQGAHNKKPFILLPWQQFAFAGIFGWKWCKDNTRVTKNALIMPTRKNGKTTLMSAIALIMATIENEGGAEVNFIANSSKQANIGFNACRNLSSSIDPNHIIFKRYRDSIKIPYNNSIIQVLCSDSMTLDGYNSSCTLIDEFHAAKDWELYNVMKSSQGMRTQPLTIVCTTAGFLLDGFPLFDMRKTCKEILKGLKKDDTQFSLIYELDEGDDYHDKANWIKCCPSLGQTVLESWVEEQITAATNQPSTETGVKTKVFNIFCKSTNEWLSSAKLSEVTYEVDLDDFRDEEAYVGIDLASVSDLTSVSIMFPPNTNRSKWPDKYVWKTINYIPYSALDSENGTLYKTWMKHSTFKVCKGNVTDYSYVLNDLLEMAHNHNIQLVAYDEYNATQFTISATNEGMPMVPFSQSLGNFNRPTKQFERLVLSKQCIIDKDPCVKWAFNNVVLRIDYHENVKPDKTTKENKIDPVIAMTEALGAFLSEGGYGDVELV